MRVELYKLIRKKTTYLLLIPLLIPILYGIGLNSNFVLMQDGEHVEFISSGIGLFEFVYTMLSIAHFFFIFIFVVIASMLMAREVESKEINLYVYRIGKRCKIIWSKFISLQIVITVYFIVTLLFSSCIYLMSSDVIMHGIQNIIDDEMLRYVIPIIVLYCGTTIISVFCLFIGTRIRTFAAFSITFILYIITMYFENFSTLKYFFPEHLAKHIVTHGVAEINVIFYVFVYSVYIILLFLAGVVSFGKKDM